MSDHPMPACSTPFAAYQLAARTMSLACHRYGASAAAAQFAPRRMACGWWSPLFDVVLPAGVPRA